MPQTKDINQVTGPIPVFTAWTQHHLTTATPAPEPEWKTRQRQALASDWMEHVRAPEQPKADEGHGGPNTWEHTQHIPKPVPLHRVNTQCPGNHNTQKTRPTWTPTNDATHVTGPPKPFPPLPTYDYAFISDYAHEQHHVATHQLTAIARRISQKPNKSRSIARQKWSSALCPIIWTAAADTKTDYWPQTIAHFCEGIRSDNPGDLPITTTVTAAWDCLRQALRLWGVQTTHHLVEHVQQQQAAITLWAIKDTRFARIGIYPHHFQLTRGQHLEDYIQEWILHRAEQTMQQPISTVFAISLQLAVMRG